MPTLNWIGKEKVINHHQDVPYRILEKKYTYSNGKEDNSITSENKIIHGDNLEALKSLLPEYEGKIKCIYIDPPYNTGEEAWVYNDNSNDPKIKKWLNEVVGKEGEDLSRHDKWLCMMYPRIKLLNKLLSEDGSIFISIDDNELANLLLLLNEIFSQKNFISTFIWEKRITRENRKEVSTRHDYIVCYAKNKKLAGRILDLLPMDEKAKSRYKNPDNDPRGVWTSVPAIAQAGHGTQNQFYTLITPSGRELDPPSGSCWRYTKTRMDEAIADNRIWFGSDGMGVPRIKKFITEGQQGLTVETLWLSKEVGTNDSAKRELTKIFDGKAVLETPKPSQLIERILQISTDQNSIILDSFAGSGTTAQAVFNLNEQDKGNRRFVLVEMENYAEDITAERIKRVIKGFSFSGKKEEVLKKYKVSINSLKKANQIVNELEQFKLSKKYSNVKIAPRNDEIAIVGDNNIDGRIVGTGGDFTYYELGQPIFLENELLNEAIGKDKIEEYVWYTETKTPYKTQKEKYLLGSLHDTAYYFFYEKERLTTLDESYLRTLKTKAYQYIIYADLCLLDKGLMDKYHIVFKKIPRDITRF